MSASRSAHRRDTRYTEAVMKAWKERDWSWDIEGSVAAFLRDRRLAAVSAEHGIRRGRLCRSCRKTLAMDDAIKTHSAIMDKYDPEKKVALARRRMGRVAGADAGDEPRLPGQQNSQRDAILAALNFNIFARHADRVRRANIAQMVNVLQAMILTDGQDGADADLSRPPHVPADPGRDLRTGRPSTPAPIHGGITLPRVDAVAARDKAGKLWIAVTNIDREVAHDIQRFTCRCKSHQGFGPNPFGAEGRQRQHLRRPQHRHPQGIVGKGRGR